MQSSDKIIVQWLVTRVAQAGIRQVVLSPGSRNAPFAIAFEAHPAIQTFVIHDERAAAFVALGLAQETGQPVTLCCTSGSACLNYYPAISEAYYRNIPLLVLTADRPAEWINQGDGQTIVQKEVFKNHSLGYLELDESGFQLQDTEDFALQVFLQQLQANWKGPLHINIGLNEPLYNMADLQDFAAPLQLDLPQANTTLPDFSVLADKKIMVLVGQMAPDAAFEQALKRFALHSNVVVLVENTSNVQDEHFNHCIDRSLNGFTADNASYHPEILISFGGAIVSKRIKAFLRKHKPALHFRVAPDFPGMDTFRLQTTSYDVPAAAFLKAIENQHLRLNQHNFKGKWKALDYLAKDQQALFETNPTLLTDYDVFANFFEVLQGPAVLHLANSSVVRYAQLFDPIKEVRYESNRGTSGIDGSVSTAVGAALGCPETQHYLICGDISALYDSNAFWTQPFPKNLKIIIIQNNGGGIFQIIPGPADSSLRQQYFEATHSTSPAAVIRGYGFEVLECESKNEVADTMRSFLAAENPIQILQIQTAQNENAAVLDQFFTFLKN